MKNMPANQADWSYMKKSSSLKMLARTRLTGNYGTSVSLTLLTGGILLLINYLENIFTRSYENLFAAYIFNTAVSVLFGAFSYLITCGYTYFFLNLCRNKELNISNLFYPFRKHPDTFIITFLITFAINWVITLPFDFFRIYYILHTENFLSISIITLICQLADYLATLFITLGFALAVPIILDNPFASSMEALKSSWRMMKGNRWQVFYVTLSFIGLVILCVMTLGIGLLWVTPYMETTSSLIYLDIIGELDNLNPIKESSGTQEMNPEFYS